MGTIALPNRKTGHILAKYEKAFENSISILLHAKKGLKPQAVFDFMLVSQLSNQLVEQLLTKTIKTFATYKTTHTLLDSSISEKLLKLFALYDKGIELFGSVDEFNKWMEEPAFGLGHQVPTTLLDTITGIDIVKEELIRIEYGDLA